MRASATMTRDVIVVPPEMPLGRAFDLMQALRVRHLPVVKDGALVGIVSDRDLMLQSNPGPGMFKDGDAVRVAMTPSPRTCTLTTPVSTLAQTMIDLQIDALPVVKDGDPACVIGLVTSTDLLWLLAERKDEDALPVTFTLKTASVDGAFESAGLKEA